MPMDRQRYPDDWEAIAFKVKSDSLWICEKCGRPCRKPGESDTELRARITSEAPDWAGEMWETVESPDMGVLELPKLGRFTLTVAHPNHDPENPKAELKAWCSPCHGRYDLKDQYRKRMIRLEMMGQLRLNLKVE